MAGLLPSRAAFICRSCQFAQLAKPSSRSLSVLANTRTRAQQPSRRTLRQKRGGLLYTQLRRASTVVLDESAASHRDRSRQQAFQSSDPVQTLAAIRHDVAHIINRKSLPSDTEIRELLGRIHSFANMLVFGDQDHRGSSVEDSDIEAIARSTSSPEPDTSSAVLDDLSEESSSSSSTPQKAIKASRHSTMSVAFRAESASTLCELLYYLVRDPKVKISSSILRVYTHTQCLLGKPEYLPEIFDLYAHKPIPSASGSTITYKAARPWRLAAAIPLDLAAAALAAAIRKRDMGLAIAITDTTVATTAYQTQRFLQHAAPKLGLMTMIPFTAYTASSWVSTYQNTFEPEMAQMMAIAGATAYIGTFGSIAFVAVTTWSDHHDRVHWEVGKSLYKRWLMEDERAFLDKVAQAWGFEEKIRRGEEQGEEWEALRDTVGLRGMVLDKTEFLQGMS